MSIEAILLDRKYKKKEVLAYLEEHPKAFEDLLELCLTDTAPQCWRAAWLMRSKMAANDPRVQPYIDKILAVINHKKEGHQRELMKVLERMQLNEEQEGRLFDFCMNTWERINLKPSVRITAFKLIAQVAKRYPTLIQEIEVLWEEDYLTTLSPGILNTFGRLQKELLEAKEDL